MASERKPNISFTIRCTNKNLSKIQFENMVNWHLRLACKGIFSNLIKDADPSIQFWQTDWLDWSEQHESDVMKSLVYFGKRYLKEIGVDESRLKTLVGFETLKAEY